MNLHAQRHVLRRSVPCRGDPHERGTADHHPVVWGDTILPSPVRLARLALRTPHRMRRKGGAPRTASRDKGLHERTFGLHGMHQIVRRPFVEQFPQRHQAEFAMPGRVLEVSGG